jgi:hypothetical protein
MIRRLLCWVFGHSWGRWGKDNRNPHPDGVFGKFTKIRVCKRCGDVEMYHWSRHSEDTPSAIDRIRKAAGIR